MTDRFGIDTCLYWGHGANRTAAEAIVARGLRDALFIVDRNLVDLRSMSALVEVYRSAGLVVTIVPHIADREPTYDALDGFVETLRESPADVIVGVGGGSTLDVAKGAGILLRNPGKAIDYRGIPVVCYPTTAGTGSEVTHTASFIDSDARVKLGINGRYVAPWFGVLMPELARSCPPHVAIAAALDAMVHAVEAVTSRNSNALSAAVGASAFAAVYRWLPLALENPSDYGVQEALLLASYGAGVAMMNAGGGPVSGISYPLGVHCGVPHGFAGGILLPHAFAINVDKGYAGYARLYDGLPDADPSIAGEAARASAFVRQFAAWYDRLGAPANLDRWSVRRGDVDRLTELTMKQRRENLELNPVPFEEADVRELLVRVVEP